MSTSSEVGVGSFDFSDQYIDDNFGRIYWYHKDKYNPVVTVYGDRSIDIDFYELDDYNARQDTLVLLFQLINDGLVEIFEENEGS